MSLFEWLITWALGMWLGYQIGRVTEWLRVIRYLESRPNDVDSDVITGIVVDEHRRRTS